MVACAGKRHQRSILFKKSISAIFISPSLLVTRVSGIKYSLTACTSDFCSFFPLTSTFIPHLIVNSLRVCMQLEPMPAQTPRPPQPFFNSPYPPWLLCRIIYVWLDPLYWTSYTECGSLPSTASLALVHSMTTTIIMSLIVVDRSSVKQQRVVCKFFTQKRNPRDREKGE
jgi:hypothetical protein